MIIANGEVVEYRLVLKLDGRSYAIEVAVAESLPELVLLEMKYFQRHHKVNQS